MKKIILVTAVALAMSQGASAANADPAVHTKTSVQETHDESTSTYWGIGIGTALGAIIGGPVGAAAGATLGGSFGYGHDKAQELEQVEASVDQYSQALSQKASQLEASQKALRRLKVTSETMKRENALQAAALADLQAQELSEREQASMLGELTKHYTHEVFYRHNESSIPQHAQSRLAGLAAFMAEHPSLTLSLSGHTDHIGDPASNLALAQARVDAIRDFLVDAGISADRISSQALGEAESQIPAGKVQDYVMDRRVAIELRLPESNPPSLADLNGPR